MPARAAATAERSVSRRPRRAIAATGKIASTPSPMNLSTSPPKACTAPAMRSNQASSAAMTARSGGWLLRQSAVKPRRSANSSAAWMVSPTPRRSCGRDQILAIGRPSRRPNGFVAGLVAEVATPEDCNPFPRSIPARPPIDQSKRVDHRPREVRVDLSSGWPFGAAPSCNRQRRRDCACCVGPNMHGTDRGRRPR